MSFYEIDISYDMKCRAEDIAKRELKAAESVGGKSIFQTEDKLHDKMVGKIGEVIFDNFLFNNKIIPYDWYYVFNGKGNDWDFQINNKFIDTKTGQMSWSIDDMKPGYKFFIAEQQSEKEVDYFVNIQVNLPLTEGYIMGYISKDEVAKYPVIKTEKMYNPARAIPISSLRDIKYLFNELGYSLNKYVKYGKEQDVQVSIFDY